MIGEKEIEMFMGFDEVVNPKENSDILGSRKLVGSYLIIFTILSSFASESLRLKVLFPFVLLILPLPSSKQLLLPLLSFEQTFVCSINAVELIVGNDN